MGDDHYASRNGIIVDGIYDCLVRSDSNEDIKLIYSDVRRKNDVECHSPEQRRFITPDGKCAVRKTNRFEKPYLYYMTDIVSALLECRWRYILLWYTASHIISWYFFALIWWVIAYAHDDLTSSPRFSPTREPCVTEVRDMINAFMFSMETQYTTGYGSRTPTVECPEAVFMLCVQNVVGMILQCCSLGIIFAKLARPKARTQAIKFSSYAPNFNVAHAYSGDTAQGEDHNYSPRDSRRASGGTICDKAVISMRDGYLCLMFRIADIRKSHVICCEAKAWVLKNRLTAEGEFLAQYRHRLNLTIDDGGSDTFLVWPVTVVHRIDRNSPLYEISAEELYAMDLEIVASLVCTIESTGQQVEVRRSYVPSEILWGHRFKKLVRKYKVSGNFHIDYNMFDRTIPLDTALCSAKALNLCRWPPPNKIRLAYPGPPRDLSFLSVSREVSKDEASPISDDELLSALSSIS